MQTANGCSAVEKVRRYQENIMSNVKTTDLQSSLEEFKKHELSHLSNEWWCFLITGLLLVLAGTFSIAYPLFTSVGVVILIGAILIICGVTTVISAFWAGKWSAFFVHILSGLGLCRGWFHDHRNARRIIGFVHSHACWTLCRRWQFPYCHGDDREVPTVGMGSGQWYRDPPVGIDHFSGVPAST